jgi:uncharacterized membrane protein
MVAFAWLLFVYGALSALPFAGFDVPALRPRRARMRIALAAMFGLTASTHFTSTETFLQMVPEFLPLRREAVYLSGIAEAAGAVGLLVPRLRRLAGLGVAALLVSVFPANVNVAVSGVELAGALGFPGGGAWSWARLALQPVMVWFALWASAEPRGAESPTVADAGHVPTAAPA